MNVLITGGAGYIGSHTLVEFINAGHFVVALDNLVNSSVESIRRVEQITGKNIPFFNVDIRNRMGLENICKAYRFDVCVHLADLKAVGESVLYPWEYYENNVNGTLVLVDVLRKYGCKNIMFSSSATVYGTPEIIPISEACPKGKCLNPYGWTKWIIEQILTDIHRADSEWNVVLLRYFNPVGAHSSGLIGENPSKTPNNLMPYITQVAIGKREKLHIFGNDYDTPDGTGVRDYIHVVDLAKGHLAALKAIKKHCGVEIYNIGTGKGYSVLEIIKAFEEINRIKIPYVIDPRRLGDIDTCFADSSKALKDLGWRAEFGLNDMVRDAWNWQKMNPDGYSEKK